MPPAPGSPALLFPLDARQIEEAQMTRFKLLLFVAVLVGFAAPAYAGYDEGKAAYDRGDYAKAYKEFKPLAEHGDADAQGYMGEMYYLGHGVPQSYVKAVKWYRRAAEQGDDEAQFELGLAYAEGQGVPQDHAEAIKWYRKAAEQGDDEAQFELGWAYTDGKSVPQDFIQAYMWFDLAAAHENDTYAEDYAGDFRDSLAEKMTPAQIAEARRLAREWKPKGRD